jgi:hypothetical protein
MGQGRVFMHASIACLLLYEAYVWVSLGNAMKAKQSEAKQLETKFLNLVPQFEVLNLYHGKLE